MNAKLIFSFVLAFVVGQTYSLSYQDAFKDCMKTHNLEKDDPLKAYMSIGRFASEEEQKNLKCFFSCLTEKLEISDATGKLDGPKLKELATKNPTETELVVFASEEVQKACIPLSGHHAAHAGISTCEAVFHFTQCALETQAQSAQKKP